MVEKQREVSRENEVFSGSRRGTDAVMSESERLDSCGKSRGD